PGNVATPTALAAQAQAIAERAPFIKVTVYDRAQARELGMGAFLAVAQGSAEEPRFIVLEHRLHEFPDPAPVVLVGKGITFDSGGISIKPSEGLYQMKDDMSGGAAVIGTFAALAEMNVPLPVVGLVPATENMLDATSFRPGDVMTNLSGKTIENQNSDAEGRLVLSDALAYAERYHPRAIVDLATLTGAMVVALGQSLIGAFSTDPRLLDRLKQAGETSAEPLWEMPLYEPYAKFLESDVADIRNIGPRWGGAITAALFLKYFVPENVPWAHLDIAGVAWNHSDRKPKPAYYTPGATGAGVRLLVEFLERYGRP
ncbi:MAG TPA: leucyl aminopeptidase, partial [Chloroflexi bacterium]|nr:leucyl aminopeptidase [Chloroflexota bacterium]